MQIAVKNLILFCQYKKKNVILWQTNNCDMAETQLQKFATRVRQLILQYNELRGQLDGLQTKIRQQEMRIEELQKMVTQSQANYQSLKMAKMIDISDNDVDNAQRRLQKLIRDVNKCITLLSEK